MTSRYFFHVTDGDVLHIDRFGERLSNDLVAEYVAEEKACNFMERTGPSRDWSGWLVCVYDDAGSAVAEVLFADAAPAQLALAA